MSYPSYTPTSRSFDPGDYPAKTYRSQSGVEVRILYGNKRTGLKLSLTYSNITDAAAQAFVTHYDEMKGTLNVFSINTGTKDGWEGDSSSIDVPSGNAWRYERAPQLNQVRPGISAVTVDLIGVL